MSNPVIQLPAKLEFLLKEQTRYKVAYGGRGGAKSWAFAIALLIKGIQNSERILCAREFQNSIDESVHQLLSTVIRKYNLEPYYEVQAKKIFSKINQTQISFAGLRRNIGSMKSFEGTTICWVEEAQTVSKNSWEILIPTIRAPNSEIWLSFNPDLDTDETYQRFVAHPRENSIVVKINYNDNPWFPDVLREEMEELKRNDYDAYLNVWEGNCKRTVDGAVYAKEIRDATQQNRITKVPYESNIAVHTFWDIGYADFTAIWFAQFVGFEIHVIDYYQNRLQGPEHYIKYLDKKQYRYGTAYLPHDGANKTIQGAGVSFQMQLQNAGYKAECHQRENKTTQIASVRSIFNKCYFDENNCNEGINVLSKYKYKVNDKGQFSKDPDHDESSHGADAFAQLAIHLKPTVDTSRLPQMARTDFDIFG